MARSNPTISFALMSLKNFQDRNLARQVIETINSHGEIWTPTKFDHSEPLKKQFNANDLDEVIRVWMNPELNDRDSGSGWQQGDLLMVNKKGTGASYFIHWTRQQNPHFNFVVCNVPIKTVQNDENMNEFMQMCLEFCYLIEPAQGAIYNSNLDETQPLDLTVRHPELYWMNFFGKPYIELFGRGKLLSTPCHKVIEITQNLIALQLAENVFDLISEDVRDKIKQHLGEDAFVWGNKSIRDYKFGVVPSFDFRQILSDSTKPIELAGQKRVH